LFTLAGNSHGVTAFVKSAHFPATTFFRVGPSRIVWLRMNGSRCFGMKRWWACHQMLEQHPHFFSCVDDDLQRIIEPGPVQNRCLIPCSMLLKVAFCGVAFGHWFTGGIPLMWKPFAVCDLVFLVLFAWTYRAVGQTAERERHANEQERH
jgi:hypothetical protein